MSFIDTLLDIDRDLFLTLNGWHHPVADWIMFYVSKMWVWIPIYLAVVVYIIKAWKKEAIWIILSMILCVVLTDQLTNLTKEFFQRPRPSHAVELQGMVHHVQGYLGGKFGFVSGHSSNVFGFALLSSLIIRQRWFYYVAFFWAALVAYSRIYLGVHYPLDILGGMVLGMSIAGLVYMAWQTIRKKLIAEIKHRFF